MTWYLTYNGNNLSSFRIFADSCNNRIDSEMWTIIVFIQNSYFYSALSFFPAITGIL